MRIFILSPNREYSRLVYENFFERKRERRRKGKKENSFKLFY